MDHAHDTSETRHSSEATYYVVFFLLIVLLGATIAASWVNLGAWNFPLAVLIASVKAALILLFFMHVRDSQPLVWVIACAGFFFLAILFGITFSDYRTRSPQPSHRDSGALHGQQFDPANGRPNL